MQYIELFPLQRILQSNQIAERAIRHEYFIFFANKKIYNNDSEDTAVKVQCEWLNEKISIDNDSLQTFEFRIGRFVPRC